MTILNEGGNVFKNKDGSDATIRINQTDVKPTVAWLEQLTGLPLLNNMLGTTGKKPTSGDLDLAVDTSTTTKDALSQRLTTWCTSHSLEPREWIRKTGISVHFKTPINGQPARGFVQTDFMFVDDIDFAHFIIAADPASAYTGMHRFLVLNSVAKPQGFKLTQNSGLVSRANNEPVSRDPDEIAKILFGRNATRNTMMNVETIVAALANDPARDAKLADARDFFAKQNIPFDTDNVAESVESESYFLARLRNRIVDCGMTALVESTRLCEGARIEHPEDRIFDEGSTGALRAVAALQAMLQSPTGLSIKWDGKPAVVLGYDSQGFVLTDKSGFTAKGYNGLARSPSDIATVMSQRSGDRTELIAMYQRVWTPLKSLLPVNFNGFLLGDLLWTEPLESDGSDWIFTPNTVTYRIAKHSDLGKRVSKCRVGIAFHTYFSAPGSEPQPWSLTTELHHSGTAMAFSSVFENPPINTAKPQSFDPLIRFIHTNAQAIDALFNPTALRAGKITDLPGMMKKFINHQVRMGSLVNLTEIFLQWLEAESPNPGKFQRSRDHLAANQAGWQAAMKIFVAITEAKTAIVRTLDSAEGAVRAEINGERGHEGYVYSADGDMTKMVDRLRFSRANFARHQ